MNVAKLPSEFTKKAPCCLSDLQLGEEGAIEFMSMLFDAEGRCNVNPEAKLQDDSVPWSLIYVVRTVAGLEVSIPRDSKFKWTLGQYLPEHDAYCNWLAVAKLTVIETKPRAGIGFGALPAYAPGRFSWSWTGGSF